MAPKLLQGQVKQTRELLVSIDGPGLMEMTSNLQGGQPVKQNPDNGGDLSGSAGAEQCGVLGPSDHLGDGGHGVIGGRLESRIRFGDRGVPEDQLVVVGMSNRVVDIRPAAGTQPLPRVATPLRTSTNALGNMSQRSFSQGTHQRRLVCVVPVRR